ncbi:unnamed protein product [Bursaphelenchus okinawaensis]|uniref:Uncharacterized protein n=1 Tax=Bursaphelenchus okinawaensis TaxID=465554 RepID=A0A811JTW5_9BILA|nr:unnamed protein product [Bursaphelenchus okinawaensis]CAG9083662.1 unnamed protein product [Bursaphelenchus okinawaensis]
MFEWRIVAIAITIVELQAKERAAVDKLAWCDTIECQLLFLSSDVDYLRGNSKNQFSYVPSEDLLDAWGPDVGILVKEHYTDFESNGMYPGAFTTLKEPLQFTYTYIPELGRFQDIILRTEGKAKLDDKKTPANLMNYSKTAGPYSIFSFGKTEGCLDSYGYYTNRAYNSYTCMYLMNVRGRDGEIYAGPLSWNRIQFLPNDYYLRFLLTNRSFAVSGLNLSDDQLPSMKDFTTCIHAPEANNQKSVCYTLFGIYMYSTVCCCYDGNCDKVELPADTQRNYLTCPVGEYTSAYNAPRILETTYDEMGQTAIGTHCELMHQVGIEMHGDVKTATLVSRMGGRNLTDEEKFRLKQAMADDGVACYINQTICPGAVPSDYQKDGITTFCVCNTTMNCFRHTNEHFKFINQFFGRILLKDAEQMCKKFTFLNDSFYTDRCQSLYDPRKEESVNLYQDNNFHEVYIILKDELTKKDIGLPGEGEFNLYLLNGFILDRVIDSCTPEEAVYTEQETGVRNSLLFIQFTCKWPMCDEYFDEHGKEIMEALKGYKPLCAEYEFTSHSRENFYARHGTIDYDFAYLKAHIELLENTETGYCMFKYVAPETEDSDDYGYIVRRAHAYDMKMMKCPSVGAENPEMCTSNPETNYVCCLPFIEKLMPRDSYVTWLFKAFNESVTGLSIASTADAVSKEVDSPGKCAVYSQGDDTTGGMMDLCGAEVGCYTEFLNTAKKSGKTGGCVTAALDYTRANPVQPFHAASLCRLTNVTAYSVYPYKNVCAFVDNNKPTLDDGYKMIWPDDISDTDRLRSSKIVCCCMEPSGCKYDFDPLYYGAFLDEYQVEIQEWIDNYKYLLKLKV